MAAQSRPASLQHKAYVSNFVPAILLGLSVLIIFIAQVDEAVNPPPFEQAAGRALIWVGLSMLPLYCIMPITAFVTLVLTLIAFRASHDRGLISILMWGLGLISLVVLRIVEFPIVSAIVESPIAREGESPFEVFDQLIQLVTVSVLIAYLISLGFSIRWFWIRHKSATPATVL